MKNNFILWVMALAILIMPFLINWRINMDHDEIETWAKGKDYKVIDTEIHLTTIGTPFYYAHKNCFIYGVKVETTSGKKEHWWVRNNPFSNNDYVKE